MKQAWPLLVAVALLATACGGVAEEAAERMIEASGEGDVEIDLDDGSVSLSFDDGERSIVSGSNVDLPDELTFPVPEGGNVTTAATQGSYVAVAIQYPVDRFDELVAFFDGWTGDHERDWRRSESTVDIGGATVRNVTWNAGAALISVNDCISLAAVQESRDDFDAACLTMNEDI